MATLEERMVTSWSLTQHIQMRIMISKYRKLIKSIAIKCAKALNVEWDELSEMMLVKNTTRYQQSNAFTHCYNTHRLDNFATKIEDVSEIMNYYVT